jgi:hypothetical protein
MEIRIYQGFLSPTKLHTPRNYKPTKAELEEKIENKLIKLGFKINGSNFAQYTCKNISELDKMFVQLRKIGIHSGAVHWS